MIVQEEKTFNLEINTVNSMEKWVERINRITILDHSIIALIKLFMFIISSVLGLIIISKQKQEFYNAFFLFVFPIAVDTAINCYITYQDIDKNNILFFFLGCLSVLYFAMTVIALCGIFKYAIVVKFIFEHSLLMNIFISSYGFIYFIEMIILFCKDILVKRIKSLTRQINKAN